MEALPAVRKFNGDFLAVELREIYTEKGEYEFKIALDPKKYENCDGSTVQMLDSDGNPIELSIRRWGTKICVSFRLTDHVSDGYLTIKVTGPTGERASYGTWFVK